MTTDLLLIVSVIFLVLSLLILVILLVLLLTKSQKLSSQMLMRLLQNQQQENQLLRNQLRSQDVPTLLGLNHATLSSNATASNEHGSEPIDLGEAIAYEEQMAKQGYKLGDIPDEFESSGWASPIVRNDGSSDPVAFEF